MQLVEIPIRDLPLYSPDHDAECPAVAQTQRRGVLRYSDSPLMNNVEADIRFKPGLITADGEVTDERLEKFLRNYMAELHGFVVRVLTVLPHTA